MNRKQWLTVALFFVALAGAYLAGRAGRQDAGPTPGGNEAAEGGDEIKLSTETERRMGLRLAPATVRTIQQTIQATGTVRPDETRVAHIRAMARGRIEAVYVRLGEHVGAGQRLFQYDNVELGEAVGQYLGALAALEKAATEAEVARRSLERAKSLVDRGALARAEHDRREAEHRNALASLESHKAAAAGVEEKLHRFGMSDPQIERLSLRTDYHREASHTTVFSPLAGTLTLVGAVPGESVTPDNLLVTVADLSTVWVQADVYEKDIAAVRPGAAVTVTLDAYPGRGFPGRITYVSHILDPETRTAKVRCEAANSQGLLKLEMFATVRVPAGAARAAVAIPVEAVQNMEGRPVAFLRSAGGGYLSRPLKLGQRSDGWVEVLEGIQAGDQVVTQGSFVLKSEAMKAELGHDHE